MFRACSVASEEVFLYSLNINPLFLPEGIILSTPSFGRLFQNISLADSATLWPITLSNRVRKIAAGLQEG